MIWVILAVGVLVIAITVGLAIGRIDGAISPMSAPSRSLLHQPLPDTPVDAAELERLRFDVAPRGYRMDQVDAVIARLQSQLAEREAAALSWGPENDPEH